MVTTGGEPVLRGSPYRADCPTRRILDRIGDRWTVLVVGALWDGSARFSELRRRIEGVSQKMLTQTLRGLERDGLVRRTVYPEVPVRVEYTLTEAGRTLREPLRALEEWSIAHLGDVAASQQAYDRGSTPS
jgi:DNA-binding HxlR family transcriptional regulator